MARIINTANPGKVRNQHRRTIAELLRQIMLKRDLDQDTKDMAATMVLSLRAIAGTIEITCTAWEKRNYFLKADRFRLSWEWVSPVADELEGIIVGDSWEQLPIALASLAPRFADIRIAKMTRPPSVWEGGYQELLRDNSAH